MADDHPFDPTRVYELAPLRYVQAIARNGSMTAAAKALRLSQPTLSVAMQQLEARLGTSLFLRGPKGVVLTASGAAVVRLADAVLALVRHADDEIRGIESKPRGHFILGCYHSLGAFFLPELMRGLCLRAPDLELALWEGTTIETRDAVLARDVHFGVGVWPAPHPELVLVPLFRDVMAVMRGRRTIPKGAPLFFVPRIGSNQKVVDRLRAQRQLPERVVACEDVELVKSLVLEGAGTGVMPWRAAIYGTVRGALRLLDPKLPFEVELGSLFYRADLHRTRAAMLMRDELTSRGRQLDAVELPCGVPSIAKRKRLAG